MKFFFTLFFFYSHHIAAHPPMKTGFQTTLLTEKELTAYLRQLPLSKKEQLAHQQLQQFIDPVIFKNIAYEDLKNIRFSATDSLETLSRKYERLALHLQSLSLHKWESETQRAFILAHCYALSADYLSRTLGYSDEMSAIDPHISISQLIRWSARFTIIADSTAWERHSHLLLIAFDHLQTASSFLQNATLTDVDEFMRHTHQQNQLILENLTDKDLEAIDSHPISTIRHSSSQAWKKPFIDKKIEKAQQKLIEQLIPKHLITKTLSKYKASIEQRLEETIYSTRADIIQEHLKKRPTYLHKLLYERGFIKIENNDAFQLEKVLQNMPIDHTLSTSTWNQKIEQYKLVYTTKIESEKKIIANLLTQLKDIKKMDEAEKWTLQIFYDTPTEIRLVK